MKENIYRRPNPSELLWEKPSADPEYTTDQNAE